MHAVWKVSNSSSLNIYKAGHLFWMKSMCHCPALFDSGTYWIAQNIQKTTCRMQATGREKGDRKKAVQPTLLHRGSTVSTLFWFTSWYSDSPHSFGSREEGSGTKKVWDFYLFVCVWTHVTKRGQFDLLKLKWQTSLSRHWALTIKPREPVKELVWTYSANRQQTGKSFEGYGKCSRGQWSEIQNATTLYYGK